MEKLLIGIAGAIAGGIFTIAGSYLTARYRMRELEYNVLRRGVEGRLSAARNKLAQIYIPLNENIEILGDSFKTFWRSKDDVDKEEFLSSFEALKTFYSTVKKSGDSLFLVPEIYDELEHFIRFIEQSKNSSGVSVVVITKIEALGMRESYEKIYPQWLGVLSYLFFLLMNRFRSWIGFASSVNYFIDTAARTYCAPLDSEDFCSEFSLCISSIKAGSREIALSKESSVEAANQ